MSISTISTADYEEALRMWDFGAWCRTAWIRDIKTPGWVKQIKTLDREKQLGRLFIPVDDKYGQELDSLISKLPRAYKDVTIAIYVNLKPVPEIAKEMQSTDHKIRDARKQALTLLYSKVFDFEFDSL